MYISARSEQRAKAAIERMRAEGLQPGNGEVLWFQLDLSDPRKAKESAEEFLKREDRLDVLGGSMSNVFTRELFHDLLTVVVVYCCWLARCYRHCSQQCRDVRAFLPSPLYSSVVYTDIYPPQYAGSVQN